MDKGAEFSPCRTWRYALWRIWDDSLPLATISGLNPSTANENDNDTTISKCIGFTQRWGLGGFFMLNPCAFCSTFPNGLLNCADPIGPGNDDAYRRYVERASFHLAACGSVSIKIRARVRWETRIAKVKKIINAPLYCLGRTQDGSPRHPSRLGYGTVRELFWSPQLPSPQPTG